ncbi:MAG: hypothetical protein WCP29_00530 [Acidobacteriota bacterium]
MIWRPTSRPDSRTAVATVVSSCLRRVGWPVAAALVLGVPLVITLAGSVPNTIETDVAPRLPAWPIESVALGTKVLPDGTTLAGGRLDMVRPEPIVRHEELLLAMELYGSSPALVEAEIQIRGTDCVYRTEAGAALAAGQYLSFHRGRMCGHVLHGPANGQLALRLVYRGGNRIGVMASRAPAGSADQGWISVPMATTQQDGRVAVAWARYRDSYLGGARSRAELLAYVWQLSNSTRWVWLAVACALFCVCAGGMLLSIGASASGPLNVSGMFGVSCGVAAVSLGLAVLYASLVPPLQAPDEPDFFLAFAEVANRPALAVQTAELGRTGHLARIMFHDDQRVRPYDVGRPFDQPWLSNVNPPPPGTNSVIAAFWWTRLAGLVASMEAPGALLSVRLANAALFAVCLGAATLMLLVVLAGEVTSPQLIALTLLLVPTLPFFAMYVSEFAIQASVYAFLAAVAAGLFLDTRRGYLLGFPLGIGSALALASGRNALPYMAVVGALCVGRAVLGTPDDRATWSDWRRTGWFWLGLAGGFALYPLTSTSGFVQGLWTPDAVGVSDRFRTAAELLRRHPWLLVGAVPFGFVLERAAAVVRRKLGPPPTAALTLVRVLAYGAATSVALSLAVSVFARYPQLSNVDLARPSSVREYVSRVMGVAVSGFRLTNHDLYLSSWFWGGFGWVDTMPGTGFVSLLVLLAAAGAIGTLASIARTRQIRRALWLGALMAGWGVALGGYAASTYYLHRNLHGRYVVALYLVTLGVCWSIVAWLPRTGLSGRFRRFAATREWALLILIAAVHAYALRFILVRYF